MKKVLALILATMMVVALVACGGGAPSTSDPSGSHTVTDVGNINKDQGTTTPDANATYKKEVTVALWQAIDAIDPHLNSGNAAESIYKMIYNQLVNYDWATGTITPDLAESWEVENAASYVFHLRKGVKFSNGEELTADDVVYTFAERPAAVQGTTGSAVWNAIEKVEAIDEYTVRIKLTEKDADFMNRIYLAYFAILNREACEADPEKGYTIGTGGWTLNEFKPNDEASFNRCDTAWIWAENGLNPTEKVTFRFITEGTTRSIALQNKEIAAAGSISNADVASLKSAGTNVITYEAETLHYLFFNMKNGKLAEDVNLRKAIAYALDYQEIVDYATAGLGSRAISMWGKSQYGLYEDFEEQYDIDHAKVKEYLTKAGYPDGFEFELVSREKTIAPLVQAQLKAVGIIANVTLTDTAGASAIVKSGDFDMMVYSITLQPIGGRFAFIPDINHSTNRAKYDNPDMLAKFTEAKNETDDAKRKEIYKEIQIELHDQIPYLGLYYPASNVAYCEGVTGILWELDNKPDYSGIRWAE